MPSWRLRSKEGGCQLYEILARQDLKPNVHLFQIAAPAVARKARAGQFVIVMVDEEGERVPLTIADFQPSAGTVSFVFMQVGKTTQQLARLGAGDRLYAFVGPLGIPTHIERYGTVVCVGGGFGVATLVPIASAMREAGNKVISVMGFRTRDLLFWEDELRAVSDELIITTDDGSYGRKGVVTEPIKHLLMESAPVDLVVAIGPAIMMKFVAKTTEPFGVQTIASLNPIMIDGTGLCGGCRVTVGGQTKFACVDGPDVDAHLVDWDELMARQRTYLAEEKLAVEQWQHDDCRLTRVKAPSRVVGG